MKHIGTGFVLDAIVLLVVGACFMGVIVCNPQIEEQTVLMVFIICMFAVWLLIGIITFVDHIKRGRSGE